MSVRPAVCGGAALVWAPSAIPLTCPRMAVTLSVLLSRRHRDPPHAYRLVNGGSALHVEWTPQAVAELFAHAEQACLRAQKTMDAIGTSPRRPSRERDSSPSGFEDVAVRLAAEIDRLSHQPPSPG